MSLTNPNKIIQISEDLSETTERLSIKNSDALIATLAMREESLQVSNEVDSDLSRAISHAEESEAQITKLRNEAEAAKEKASELAIEIDKYLTRVIKLHDFASENLTFWRKSYSNSLDWNKIATKELERAINEYNKAVDDYNKALDVLKAAQRSLRECLNSGYRDKNGNYQAPSCSWEKSKVQNCENECQRLQAILDKKKEVLDRAQVQYDLSCKAVNMSENGVSEGRDFLEKMKELEIFTKNTYKECQDAISAAQSALNILVLADKNNKKQFDLNDESQRMNKVNHDKLNELQTQVTKVESLVETCNRNIALLRSEMEHKSSMMNLLKSLLPEGLTFK